MRDHTAPGARSLYRWRGAVTDAPEALVLLKTLRGQLPTLEQALHALHSYDVPKLLALPVSASLPAYRGWVTDETTAIADMPADR